jgi:uncharacterized phage infection (PIP) family protein YhgE
MEKTVAEVTQDVSDAEMEAAFNSVSTTTEQPAEPAKEVVEAKEEKTETVEEAKKVEPEKPVEAAPVTPPLGLSEDQLKLLSAIPELEKRLTQQVDKVAGNYGEVKRLLDTMQKAAATPQGAAHFEASADADELEKEFPEIANGVQDKINRAFAKVPQGLNTEQLEEWYTKREAVKYQEAVKILDTAHPDRVTVKDSPEWKQWVSSLPEYQQVSVMNSEDPYYVSSMISKFKIHRDKQTSLQEKSKQRIENAITPQGVRPTGQSTISEDEAAQKAFDAQFN